MPASHRLANTFKLHHTQKFYNRAIRHEQIEIPSDGYHRYLAQGAKPNDIRAERPTSGNTRRDIPRDQPGAASTGDLLLDNSASMRTGQAAGQVPGNPSDEAEAPRRRRERQSDDPNESLPAAPAGALWKTAADAVEVTAITFGGSPKDFEWLRAGEISFPELAASGEHAARAGDEAWFGFDKRAARPYYHSKSFPSFVPWMFILTDGAEGQELNACHRAWRRSMQGVGQGNRSDGFQTKLIVFAITYPKVVDRLRKTRTFVLQELAYETLFEWISASMGSVSRGSGRRQVIFLSFLNR